MSWVTVIWSMIASACLTLAVIYFLVWYRSRTSWAHLLFSLSAFSTAAFAFFELWMMRAADARRTRGDLKWAQVPIYTWLVSILWFVRIYLGAGRRWLAWTISGVRACALWLNFTGRAKPQLSRDHGARTFSFSANRSRCSEASSIRGCWSVSLSNVLLLVFVADAGITAWRRGDRRKALMVGGSVEFFVLIGFGQSALVFWANLQMPITLSVLYMGMISVMGYELSRDVLRASQLVGELQASEAGLRESEARMSLAVDAADFGLWIRDLARNDIWASDKWRDLFGFAPAAPLTFDAILSRLHPDDRDEFQRAHAVAVAGDDGGRYQTDYPPDTTGRRDAVDLVARAVSSTTPLAGRR